MKRAAWAVPEMVLCLAAQLYPTLKPIAQKFGTYREHGEAAETSR
jgi:hypothetical protein